MMDPAYFAKPLTHVSVKHPRLGERNVEQRPVKPTAKKCLTCPDNGGTNCQAA